MIENKRSRLLNPSKAKFLVSFIVPGIFLILVMFFYPARTQFQADTDEGLNLMRAMLVDKGYSLYDDIWSDHPPLLPNLLAAGFRLVGYRVGFARYLILLLSLLQIWAAGRILDRIWGTRVSLVGQVLLILVPDYLPLSVSIMIGFPSIAIAMLSLWALVEWHYTRKSWWLVVSAALLSLSVLTKIFLIFLGPVFCLGILLSEYFREKRKIRWSILWPPFVFGVIFSLILISAAVFWIGLDNLNQLWEPHVIATTVERFVVTDIHYFIFKSWPMIILALIGVYDIVREKTWAGLYLFAWVSISYALLLNHDPIWYHHHLYITIPAALLAAAPASKAFERFWEMLIENFSLNLPSVLQIAAIFCVIAVVLPYSLPEPVKLLSPVPDLTPAVEMAESEKLVMAYVDLYKDQTEWVVTDSPMYVFRNRLSVPPEMVVFSMKRLETGQLTEQEVIQAISEYQPEQVLFWRFYLPNVDEYLAEIYYPVYSIGDKKLWIRNDIERLSLP